MIKREMLLLVCVSVPLFLVFSLNAEEKESASVDKTAEMIVAERAEGRWRSLIEADVDGAYSYLTPAHRKGMPIELYQVNLNPGMWRDIRVDSASCDPIVRACEVVLFLKYDLNAVKGIEMKKKESWIEEAGNWWYVPRK
jgi:hypothetical protein